MTGGTDWQAGYDEGRRMGTKFMRDEVARLKAENEALRSNLGAETCKANSMERLALNRGQELDALRKSLAYIRDTSDDWHVCEKAADALVDASAGDIPDFTPGNGNKARRRADELGIDYDAAMGKEVKS